MSNRKTFELCPLVRVVSTSDSLTLEAQASPSGRVVTVWAHQTTLTRSPVPKCVRTCYALWFCRTSRSSVLADHVRAIRIFNFGKILYSEKSGIIIEQWGKTPLLSLFVYAGVFHRYFYYDLPKSKGTSRIRRFPVLFASLFSLNRLTFGLFLIESGNKNSDENAKSALPAIGTSFSFGLW